MKPVSRSAASTVSRWVSSTAGVLGFAVDQQRDAQQIAGLRALVDRVGLQLRPAGTIGELTTERSFSAALASTNCWVSATVPVTVPPACADDPGHRVDVVVGGVGRTEQHDRLVRQVRRGQSAATSGASKSSAALSFSLSAFFSSVSALIWFCISCLVVAQPGQHACPTAVPNPARRRWPAPGTPPPAKSRASAERSPCLSLA